MDAHRTRLLTLSALVLLGAAFMILRSPEAPQTPSTQTEEPAAPPPAERTGDARPTAAGSSASPNTPPKRPSGPLSSPAREIVMRGKLSQAAQRSAATAVQKVQEAQEEPEELEPVMFAPTSFGIDNAVRSNMDKMRGCYQAWLNAEPDLGGRIVVKFTIAPEEDDPSVAGIQKFEIFESEVDHLLFEGCVGSLFEELKFESPEGGGVVVVRYPLTFSSDDQE